MKTLLIVVVIGFVVGLLYRDGLQRGYDSFLEKNNVLIYQPKGENIENGKAYWATYFINENGTFGDYRLFCISGKSFADFFSEVMMTIVKPIIEDKGGEE